MLSYKECVSKKILVIEISDSMILGSKSFYFIFVPKFDI